MITPPKTKRGKGYHATTRAPDPSPELGRVTR